MQTDSAPATRCSISVRQGGKRVALMELDPSTTLRECLQQLPATVDAPALVDDAWRGPVPRDGSTCGAAVDADGEDTVDGSHPTDLGFMRQAEAFYPLLKSIVNT